MLNFLKKNFTLHAVSLLHLIYASAEYEKLWQKLLCKLGSLFGRVNLFPPNFSFTKYKRKIWREKNT
jgi:hypothetical protein